MMFAHTTQMFFGADLEFRRIVEVSDRYAASAWPILLLGETGVGKELFARRIHGRSACSTGPFVPVNCGALPSGLIESELFGHERGAFSGAQQPHRGLIRSAQGGTLFLDEIGDLDLNLQVKLLRLLDSGEVRPVGSNRFEYIDVRIVAATNVELAEAVRQKTFRPDLLERLSVLTVSIPPLRDRGRDIVLIASELLDKLLCTYTLADLNILKQQRWPGNVRQLRNFLIRASVRGQGDISLQLLEELLAEDVLQCARAGGGRTLDSAIYSDGSLADIERRAIVERLKKCRGNRKRAARELGIAKSTLHDKLRKWKLASPGDDSFERSDTWIPKLEPKTSSSYASGMAI